MSNDYQQPTNGVGEAFYDLTVAQRNAAWAEVETLKSRLAAIEGHIAKYETAVRTAIDEQSWEYLTNVADHRHDWYYEPITTAHIDSFFVDLQRELEN